MVANYPWLPPLFQPDTQLQFRRTSKDSSLGNNNLKMNEKRLSADSEGKSWRKSSVVANPNVEASSPIADGKNSSIIQNKVCTLRNKICLGLSRLLAGFYPGRSGQPRNPSHFPSPICCNFLSGGPTHIWISWREMVKLQHMINDLTSFPPQLKKVWVPLIENYSIWGQLFRKLS